MSDRVTGATPDPESLKALLKRLQGFPPKVRTGVRRELRQVGDETIAQQRAILAGPLPAGTTKTGFSHKIVHARRKGKFFLVKTNVYTDTDVKSPGRSTGMRAAISAGLRTRVVATPKRQSIEIKTTGPKVDGYNKAKFWNKRRFRHPVFGNKGRWVDQQGKPYFRAPVLAGRDDMVRRAESVLREASRKL